MLGSRDVSQEINNGENPIIFLIAFSLFYNYILSLTFEKFYTCFIPYCLPFLSSKWTDLSLPSMLNIFLFSRVD